MKSCFFILFLSFITNGIGQIIVAEPVKELGDIFESRGSVSTKFKLTNPYKTDTIHILHVETSCGCTAIFSQDTVIMPGNSIEMEVRYNPEGRLGLFVKSVAVHSYSTQSGKTTLYLKISGNVISEHTLIKPIHTSLIEYQVAPVYFYPITAFDTSYLDFNFITSFVNDLTYEIDFYQFTTIGFEVTIPNNKHLEEIEYLLRFVRNKLIREFQLRGFFTSTLFFDEPVFKIGDIPVWATAKIKAFSSNFNTDLSDESSIKVSKDEFVENTHLVLNYQRFSMPSYEDLLQQVNFEILESKLFMNSHLALKGILLTPKKVSEKEQEKIINQLEKRIYKVLKKTNGISKSNIEFAFDSVATHPQDKYKFVLWDKSDEQEQQTFRFEVKQDKIVPPLLPTYKQSMLTRSTIDTSQLEFKRFWKNLVLNAKYGHKIHLIIESSISEIPRNAGDDNLVIARKRATTIGEYLKEKFLAETGSEMSLTIKPLVHGPAYNEKLKKHVDYSQHEYINLIPTTHSISSIKTPQPTPYQVNFDYYFTGIDTASWLFDKFATYIAAAVLQDGYVELRIESSISKIPIEHDLPNEYLVYSRANESEKRLREAIKKKLVDDNRVIFTEQRYLIQGPDYDGKIPIIQYRRFQYIKIVPQKHLTHE